MLNWNHVLFPDRFFAPHDHVVGTFVEVSLNPISSGAIPDVIFVVKVATGAGTEILIHVTWFEILDPPVLVEVKLILQFPTPNI